MCHPLPVLRHLPCTHCPSPPPPRCLTPPPRQLEEEEATKRAAAEFRAQPCTVTRREPYQPQRSARGPTAPRTPLLHTDQRSARRQSFEERQKQRDAELQAAQLEVSGGEDWSGAGMSPEWWVPVADE